MDWNRRRLQNDYTILEEGRCLQNDYTILEEGRIRHLQNNDISKVSTHLSVSRGVASTLLRRNNWNTDSVFEEWFSDEGNVRKSVGLLPEQESPKPDNYCKICFEIIEVENMLSGTCGHPFCIDCWKSYIAVSINTEGPGCLGLRCPEPQCKANPGLEFIDSLASDEDKNKYYRYLLRSYVEGKPSLKWCPGPGCDLAVQIDDSGDYYDVICDCSYEFCWNCLEERHVSVDCKTVEKWMKLNTSDTDKAWIRAFTKPCPACGKNIEKNEGCYHMNCPRPCGHQFCWTCLSTWKGNHQCEKYEKDDVGKKRLKRKRTQLKRYAHCYERWAWHHKCMGTELDTLRRAKCYKLTLPYLIEQLERIVESRRELKWTFAYGYYNWRERKIWSPQAALIEAKLEILQHFAEAIVRYGNKNSLLGDDFMNFFQGTEKLVGALENDLSHSQGTETLVGALENDLSDSQGTETLVGALENDLLSDSQGSEKLIEHWRMIFLKLTNSFSRVVVRPSPFSICFVLCYVICVLYFSLSY